MPPSWRDGLVNAFPIPSDRKLKKGSKKSNNTSDAVAVVHHEEDAAAADLFEGDPFPFFNLPAEIRNRIYRLILFSQSGSGRADGRRKSRRTAILATSQRAHQEAAYVLYSTSSFRIFPLQEFTPAPVVQELRPMYRAMVTKLEMVVGSSWTGPPRSWRVSKLLAKRLSKLPAVQILRIYVELDPSGPMFEKYLISPDFYTDFCGNLLRDVLICMPSLKNIEVNGNPGVDSGGPLVSRLIAEAEGKGKKCILGPTTLDGLRRVFLR